MSKFCITREWLSSCQSYADMADEITFEGDEARALLGAAWKGMGYAPDTPTEVFDFVLASNPNWLKYYRKRASTAATTKTRPDLRVVVANDRNDE